jgi:di/tricarboxylate transporter
MDIVGMAFFNVGLANLIGSAVLKIANNDEKRLMIISFSIAALMSAFLANMTVIVFFLVIFRGAVSMSKGFKLKNLTIPMIAGAVVGGTCTLIGSTPQLAGQSIIKEYPGMEAFKMFDFAPIGIPLSVATGLALYFFSYNQGKRIWDNEDEGASDQAARVSLDEIKDESADFITVAADKKKLFIMICISLMLLVMMVGEYVSVGTAAMTAALLSIITGCVSQKKAFLEMNWNIVIWIAGCFGMAEIMTASGGTNILTTAMASFARPGMHPYLFFAIVTLVCMSITQFISNTACVLIFMPIFLPMAGAMGISPYPIAMGVIYGSSLAYLTPLASAQIGMSVSVGHTFKEIVRYGILPHIVMYIAVIIMIPIVYPF